ncbi:MAG TPA: hypothetical protein VM869_16855 [Enhygromyxa sp.]|nr:hypothetical protein [Enhygromyxa sp.]
MLKQSLSIAVTAFALLGTAACERERTADETTKERDESVEGAKTDDRARTGAGERIEAAGERIEAAGQRLDADMQRRLDSAEDRFDELERRAANSRRDLEARGGEARTELDADIEDAKANVKNKLEAARKASRENARRALDELDEAIENLNSKLGEYDRT